MSMSNPSWLCGNCDWYNAMSETYGECRRMPPKTGQNRSEMRPGLQRWPDVYAIDWCAEHSSHTAAREVPVSLVNASVAVTIAQTLPVTVQNTSLSVTQVGTYLPVRLV